MCPFVYPEVCEGWAIRILYFLTKGSNAIYLALLMAWDKSLWCLEQVLEYLGSIILPWPETNLLRISVSL